MSCGDEEKIGCGGGSAFKAWELTMNQGIVTGGNFDSNEVHNNIYDELIILITVNIIQSSKLT